MEESMSAVGEAGSSETRNIPEEEEEEEDVILDSVSELARNSFSDFDCESSEETEFPNVKRKEKYRCTDCSKHYATTFDRERHAIWHMNLRPYKCTLCECDKNRKDDMVRHLNKKHPEMATDCSETYYKLLMTQEDIDKLLSRLAKYFPHVEPVMCSQPEITPQCVRCWRKFYNWESEDLFQHTLFHTPNFKPYKCPICLIHFNQAGFAPSHFERYHNGCAVEPFIVEMGSDMKNEIMKKMKQCFPNVEISEVTIQEEADSEPPENIDEKNCPKKTSSRTEKLNAIKSLLSINGVYVSPFPKIPRTNFFKETPKPVTTVPNCSSSNVRQQCTICHIEVNRRGHREQHALTYHLPHFKLYRCGVCGERFNHPRGFRAHFTKNHPDHDDQLPENEVTQEIQDELDLMIDKCFPNVKFWPSKQRRQRRTKSSKSTRASVNSEPIGSDILPEDLASSIPNHRKRKTTMPPEDITEDDEPS